MTSILLVDDDAPFRTMLRLTLQKAGYEVAEAPDGRIALRQLAAAPVDVIITDLIMPDGEGLETIQAVRHRHPTLKIIAMSGGGRISARDFLGVARMFGANRTFIKPFAIAQLVSAIEELAPAPMPAGPATQ